MNKEEVKEKSCLFVINQGVPFKAVHEHIKTLNGFYNGAGWYVENKHKESISHLCQTINKLQCIDFPLSETFDELKRRHNKDFFREKAIKLKLQIDNLKSILKIENLETSTLIQGELRSNLEQTLDGKNLITNAEETIRLEEQIRRIEEEESIANLSIKEEEGKTFHEKLGKILKDDSIVEKLKNASYAQFEQEHKQLFSSGFLVTGFKEIDNQLYFLKGDFVVVQAKSNHGKSTLMLQLANRFISEEENQDKKPLVLFVTYESGSLQIKEKLINIISTENNEGPAIVYDRKTKEKFLYADPKGNRKTIERFNTIIQNDFYILERIPTEKLSSIINLFQLQFPERTLCIFLDYFQIVKTDSRAEGWEKMKEIAYFLEQLAIDKKVIIFSASQVNDNRETREGKDIYNAATTVLDLFNHSHSSLTLKPETKKDYIEKINNKSICTLTANKQKHGTSFTLNNYFLFNGFSFELNNKRQLFIQDEANKKKESITSKIYNPHNS